MAALARCHPQVTLNGVNAVSDLALQLNDYRLTTAEILYRLPDHPAVLQSYIWQDLDLAPDFPVLRKFLTFWTRNLDGKLYEVRVARTPVLKPAEFRLNAAVLTLH